MKQLSALEINIMNRIKELEEAVGWASHGYTTEEVLEILKELLVEEK